jgi:WD40 repeat protein
LVSASGDGSLKLWDAKKGLRSTFWYGGGQKTELTEFESPTSVKFHEKGIIASYRNSGLSLFDIETRNVLSRFDSNKTFGILLLI